MPCPPLATRRDAVPGKLIDELLTNYAAKVFNRSAVDDWAYNLRDYWYNSYFTEEVKELEKWPDEKTSADVGSELTALPKEAPTVVIRAKPFEKRIYLVLYVEGMNNE